MRQDGSPKRAQRQEDICEKICFFFPDKRSENKTIRKPKMLIAGTMNLFRLSRKKKSFENSVPKLAA